MHMIILYIFLSFMSVTSIIDVHFRNRFLNEEVARTHLLRIVKPCQYIHVANVPAGKSPSDIANLFAETGLKVLDFLGYKFIPSRKSLVNTHFMGTFCRSVLSY